MGLTYTPNMGFTIYPIKMTPNQRGYQTLLRNRHNTMKFEYTDLPDLHLRNSVIPSLGKPCYLTGAFENVTGCLNIGLHGDWNTYLIYLDIMKFEETTNELSSEVPSLWWLQDKPTFIKYLFVLYHEIGHWMHYKQYYKWRGLTPRQFGELVYSQYDESKEEFGRDTRVEQYADDWAKRRLQREYPKYFKGE